MFDLEDDGDDDIEVDEEELQAGLDAVGDLVVSELESELGVALGGLPDNDEGENE